MKKTLAAILSLVLVAGFGTFAFAGHAADEGFEYTPTIVKAGKSNIDLSGSIRIRGEFRDNTNDFDSESADYMADYDSRVRLKVDAAVSPNTKGVIEFEGGGSSDTTTWGASSNGDGTYAGEYDDEKFNNGDGNYKHDGVSIRQAYIATQGTKLLGVLSGVKAGHILTKLGNGIFLNHSKYGDDAIVLWTAPQKGTEVSLTMAKWGENNSSANKASTSCVTDGTTVCAGNDDATAYTLAVGTAVAGMNIGADVTYIDDQDYVTSARDSKGLHLWNVGLRGDADVSGVKLYADVEIQSGKAKGLGGDSDMKYKGYAWVVGANVDVPNSPVSVGAEVGYGSGDKIEDSGSSSDTGNKYEGFLTTIGDSGNLGVRKTAFLYDDKIGNAACNDSTGISCGKAGIANTWYINVGADADVTPDLNAALDIFYLRAAKGVAINGAENADYSHKRSKALGTEVDATITYQVDTNLVYYVEAGYMFAGSAYDTTAPGAGNNQSADNPYGVRHGLSLEF